MKNRLVRLALVAGTAVTLSAPLTQSASAGACNDRDFPEVCAVLAEVCGRKPVGTVCSLFE